MLSSKATTAGLKVDLWKARNEFVHGKTKQEQTNKRRREAEQKINDIYNRTSEYLPSDRSLLTGTAASFIEHKSLTVLTNWLTVWQPVFERSAARCRALAVLRKGGCDDQEVGTSYLEL